MRCCWSDDEGDEVPSDERGIAGGDEVYTGKEAPGVNLTSGGGHLVAKREEGVTISRIFSILERTFSLHCKELIVSLKLAATCGPEVFFFSVPCACFFAEIWSRQLGKRRAAVSLMKLGVCWRRQSRVLSASCWILGSI